MSIDTVTRDSNLPMLDARCAGSRRAGSRVATAVIWLACLVINAIPMATAASAHVKWFVICDASNNPLPLQAVFTPTFWLFSALFVTLFSVACVIEATPFGASLSRLLDRWTEPLHRRADALLRAVTAVSFALLWADGSVILTPELKGNSPWLSAIQVLIPIYLLGRATLPAAAAGIVVLYAYAAAADGLFHMLDYPFFLGLAAYLALSVSQNAKLRSFRFDCLRWTVALSLMWPSMEKFLYPGWIAPILTEHPELTLGVDVGTVITAAGVVEFGLAFALFWTPLVRRFAAVGLALLLFAATFDFGKMDGIGHLMIIAILVLVFADPGRKQACCHPAVAPLVSGTVLLAVIFLYRHSRALLWVIASGALSARERCGIGIIGGRLSLPPRPRAQVTTGNQAPPVAMVDRGQSMERARCGRRQADGAKAAGLGYAETRYAFGALGGKAGKRLARRSIAPIGHAEQPQCEPRHKVCLAEALAFTLSIRLIGS
jgi:hypothetical protein